MTTPEQPPLWDPWDPQPYRPLAPKEESFLSLAWAVLLCIGVYVGGVIGIALVIGAIWVLTIFIFEPFRTFHTLFG